MYGRLSKTSSSIHGHKVIDAGGGRITMAKTTTTTTINSPHFLFHLRNRCDGVLWFNVWRQQVRNYVSFEQNPYRILGVKPSESKQEIKKKYYKLCQRYHPDVNPSADAKRKMAEINSAYDSIQTGSADATMWSQQHQYQQQQQRQASYSPPNYGSYSSSAYGAYYGRPGYTYHPGYNYEQRGNDYANFGTRYYQTGASSSSAGQQWSGHYQEHYQRYYRTEREETPEEYFTRMKDMNEQMWEKLRREQADSFYRYHPRNDSGTPGSFYSSNTTTSNIRFSRNPIANWLIRRLFSSNNTTNTGNRSGRVRFGDLNEEFDPSFDTSRGEEFSRSRGRMRHGQSYQNMLRQWTMPKRFILVFLYMLTCIIVFFVSLNMFGTLLKKQYEKQRQHYLEQRNKQKADMEEKMRDNSIRVVPQIKEGESTHIIVRDPGISKPHKSSA